MVSIPIRGVNPGYATAAIAGIVLMLVAAALVFGLMEGQGRAERIVALVRPPAAPNEDRAARRCATSAAGWRTSPPTGSCSAGCVGWATANWLLDAGVAVGVPPRLRRVARRRRPDRRRSAWPTCSAVIPIMPGGLGIVDGVPAVTLVGFGLTRATAVARRRHLPAGPVLLPDPARRRPVHRCASARGASSGATACAACATSPPSRDRARARSTSRVRFSATPTGRARVTAATRTTRHRRRSPATDDDTDDDGDYRLAVAAMTIARAPVRPLPRGLRRRRRVQALAGQDDHRVRRPPLLHDHDEPPPAAHQRLVRRAERAGPQRGGRQPRLLARARDERARRERRGDRQPRGRDAAAQVPDVPRRHDPRRDPGARRAGVVSRSPTAAIVTVETKGFNQDGKEVCYFRRRVMVWKRDAAPPPVPALRRRSSVRGSDSSRPGRRSIPARCSRWGLPRLRDLPWRRTRDPWAVLVSEVMLQQTQVERVVPKWQRSWPPSRRRQTCAAASLGDVLRLWQGLGYPRRASNLHDAATVIVERSAGVPTTSTASWRCRASARTPRAPSWPSRTSATPRSSTPTSPASSPASPAPAHRQARTGHCRRSCPAARRGRGTSA